MAYYGCMDQEFEIARTSDSLQMFFNVAEETLHFDYQSGDETPIEYPHSTGWRTLPCGVIVQIVGARLEVEDEHGHIQLVNDHEAFCIAPGVRHRVDQLTPQPAVSRWSHVNLSVFGATSIFALLTLPTVFVSPVAQQLGDINAELAALHRLARPALHQVLRKKSLGFLLAATLTEVSTLATPTVSYLQHVQQFEPVLKYIASHLDQSLSREELAQLLHLSPSHFAALFKKVIGVAPGDYVQNTRMHIARQLLLQSDQAVHDVARQVGYSDLFHFSRLFKKHYGLSPSYYRSRFQAFDT